MSTRQYLIDASTKHQVFLLRYAGSTYNQMLPFLQQLKDNVTQKLMNSPSVLNKQRYQTLLQSVGESSKAILKDMNSTVKDQMLNLAKYEAGFTQRLTNTASDIPFETVIPNTKQLQAAAFTSVMDAVPGFTPVDGITVQDALSQYGAAKASDVVQAVRTGYAAGDPTGDIASTISDAVDGIMSNQAYALARTITTHVASQARLSFYEENADIITGYQVVATLDDRTTIECASLDGEVFTPEDFEPPPYHWNCRTTYIAITDPEYDSGSDVDGTRSAVGAEGAEDDVSTQTTYNSWLKTQPDNFQDEVLGKTKGDLFRAGASVQKFVDENYKPLTINQLKAQDNMHVFFDKISDK